MTANSKWIESVRDRVVRAADVDRMVNVPVIASELSAAHPGVPLIEIEQAVLGFADLSGVGILFDRGQASIAMSRGVVVEFVDEDGDEIADKLLQEFPASGRATAPDDAG